MKAVAPNPLDATPSTVPAFPPFPLDVRGERGGRPGVGGSFLRSSTSAGPGGTAGLRRLGTSPPDGLPEDDPGGGRRPVEGWERLL
jgi:hypothetical protein